MKKILKKNYYLFSVAACFLYGFLIRAVEVLTNNFVFLFDQGRDYLAAGEIVLNHKLTLIGASTGLHGVFSGPLWYYLLAVFSFLWKGDPYGGQVLMLGLGMTTLVLVFWFSRKAFNRKVALLALLLTAICGPVMSQSTMIWNPYPATVLVVFSFYFLFQYFSVRRVSFLLIAFFSMALMYNFEVTVTIAFLAYSLIFLVLIDRQTDLKDYLGSLGAVLLGISPGIIFELRHQFLQTKTFIRFFGGQETSLSSPGIDWWTQKDHLIAFWDNFSGTFNHFLPKGAMIIFALWLVFASGWLLKSQWLNKAQKRFFQYLCFFPLATFGFYVFFPNSVWQWYLTHLYFVYLLIGAITAYFLVKKVKLAAVLYTILLMLMLFSAFKMFKSRYTHDFYDLRGGAGIKGKIQAIDYFFDDARGEEFNVMVFTPPIYDYPYRYLLSWYGRKQYGYVPGSEKEGLLYLWIEPDSAKPWRHEGWLETVVAEGEILKEEELPSGFIIQKRFVEKE